MCPGTSRRSRRRCRLGSRGVPGSVVALAAEGQRFQHGSVDEHVVGAAHSSQSLGVVIHRRASQSRTSRCTHFLGAGGSAAAAAGRSGHKTAVATRAPGFEHGRGDPVLVSVHDVVRRAEGNVTLLLPTVPPQLPLRAVTEGAMGADTVAENGFLDVDVALVRQVIPGGAQVPHAHQLEDAVVPRPVGPPQLLQSLASRVVARGGGLHRLRRACAQRRHYQNEASESGGDLPKRKNRP